MTDFDTTIQEYISESQSALFEIERTIFTGRYGLSNKHFDIFSVQSISMIYSVWERFVQKSFRLYIDEINKYNLNFMDLADEIIIYSIEEEFKQFMQYPNKQKQKIKLYNKLDVFFNNPIQKVSRNFNTESNVGFSVLNRLLQSFSLETFSEYWNKYTHPEPNLSDTMFQFLRLRNSVAHGGDLSSEEKITHKMFEKYKNLVIDLMYEIRIKMIKGLNQKTYLR